MSTPPNPSEMAGMPNPPSAPAAIAESTYVAYEGIHIAYKPDDVDFTNVQRCLEDKRIRLVTVNSATFSGELQLEKEPYKKFLVMENDHFTLFSYYGPPVKFSYKSRNAVMSLLWRSIWLSDMSITQFVEVDGLWQLEQLPVLYFVFGRDADTMHSNYLIDDNTISEHYRSTATMDMTELAAVAQSKADLCVSHFFVVNRSKEYWAVDTKNPNVSYTFGPSTKTHTISRLANGSMTVQALIDEEQSKIDIEVQASQDRGFKLCDINGEEVSEGEEFVLHIQSDRDEDDDPTNESDNMYDGKDWLDVFDHTGDGGLGTIPHGAVDSGGNFGIAIIDGITYITHEDKFLQLEDDDHSLNVVLLPNIPSERHRIQISYNDDGNITLSQWGTTNVLTCEWIKASYGAIWLRDAKELSHPDTQLRMRLIKAWKPCRAI